MRGAIRIEEFVKGNVAIVIGFIAKSGIRIMVLSTVSMSGQRPSFTKMS